MGKHIVSVVLVILIVAFGYKGISSGLGAQAKSVEVVHFETGSSCAKTCVSSNRIYYVEKGSMKSYNVGSAEYFKGAIAVIDIQGQEMAVNLAISFVLLIYLLPFAYCSVYSLIDKKGYERQWI